jgi:hypothetical protein
MFQWFGSRASLRWCAGGLLLVYLGICTLTAAGTYVDNFDGAAQSIAARNLAFHGRYGVWDYQHFRLWPADWSTGPTLMLPVAAAYRLLGDGPFTANYACAFCCITVLALYLVLATRRVVPPTGFLALLTAVCLLAAVTGRMDGGVNFEVTFSRPCGDVLAGLLLLTATVVTFGPEPSRRSAVLGGTLAALAVCTKFVTVMPIVCLAGTIGVLVLRGRKPFSALALWCLAAAAVVVGFELLKLVSLGSWAAYLANVREFRQFLTTHGSSGLSGAEFSYLANFQTHLAIFRAHLGNFTGPLILPLFLLPWSLYRVLRTDVRPNDCIALALGLQTSVLFGWWFFLSHSEWVRHILPGLVLLPLCGYHLVSAEAERLTGSAPRMALFGSWILACLLPSLSPGTTERVVWPTPATRVTDRTSALFRMAEKVRALRAEYPNARFYSAGFWRHWDIQSVTDVPLFDILDASTLPSPSDAGPNYLITSDLFNLEHSPALTELVRAASNHPVFVADPFRIDELPSGNPSFPKPEPLPALSDWTPRALSAGTHNAVVVQLSGAHIPALAAIRWNGRLVPSRRDPGESRLRAELPREWTATQRIVSVDVYDPVTGRATPPVQIVITP